jgi:AcrR family transcriptional regulator
MTSVEFPTGENVPGSDGDKPSRKKAHNLYGQAMGRKGRETRERLLRATVELLDQRSIRDISVADIASLSGTSSSGFYIYFSDVPAAVLAAAESVDQITPEIESILSQPWPQSSAQQLAVRLVNAYVNFWSRHHAILRVRNLAADEGDLRFRDVRHRSVSIIHDLLEARIAEADNGLDPSAGASTVLALMERIAAISRLPYRGHHSRKSLINSAAFLVAQGLTTRSRR